MGNRCSDCNKFVGLEQGEPEVQDLEIDETGEVTGQVRVILTCADCGSEIKEAYIDLDETPSSELEDHIADHAEAGEDAESLEVEEVSIEETDRMQTTDRNGKQIKNWRYMRHFYGFELQVKITCSCGAEFEASICGEEQASAFEDMY